jgi:hypothetical protein
VKESNTTEAKGPNQDVLPHVNEEAAAFEKLAYEKRTGKKCDGNAPGSPELEQGTPVDEVRRFSHTLISVFFFFSKFENTNSQLYYFIAFRYFAVTRMHKSMLLVS